MTFYVAGAMVGTAYLSNRAASKAADVQAGAASDAAQLQRETSREQLALQREMYERNIGLQEPFRQAGMLGQNRLMTLLGLGGEGQYDDTAYNWPIFMAGSSIIMKPGDMAIYKGCEVEHWRESFNPPADQWHVQGFFHYVDANGPYASYKYDGRTSIGEKKQMPIQQANVKSYIQYTK
jgi:hypothetical protein